MKVILLQDIKGVGKKDEIINASDGYARNFLLPKKMAVEADKNNLNKLNVKKENEKQRKQNELENAKEIAEKMKTITLKIKAKSGENGKIFGGITSKEVAENLKEQYNINVDKKKISIQETIKMLGNYFVEIKLHEGITAKHAISIINE